MIEEILLLSGNNIPFFDAKINIHQPTINEISFIGEENFFMACQLLNFSKDVLSEEDRTNLVDTDNFDILMSIVCDSDALKQKVSATMLLTLLFPAYAIDLRRDGIYLQSETDSSVIDRDNYKEFQEIFTYMFGLRESTKEEYKPANEAARKIAEKLKAGKGKVEQLKNGGKEKKIAVLSRYVSILAIGLHMDLNILLGHTVYQLYDEFKRFQLYQGFDINLKARMAGASDLEEVDNWMDDIH